MIRNVTLLFWLLPSLVFAYHPTQGVSDTEITASVAELARQVKEDLAREGRKRVFVSLNFICIQQSCHQISTRIAERFYTEFSSIAGDIEVLPPTVVLQTLRNSGYHPLDRYHAIAIQTSAYRSGADAFIHGYIDQRNGKWVLCARILGRTAGPATKVMSADLPPSFSLPEEMPEMDPESGVYLEKVGGITVPKCRKCPPPPTPQASQLRSLPESRRFVGMIATVRADGAVSDIAGVTGASEELQREFVAAVIRWKYEPARDRMNRPVSARTNIFVRYELR